MTPKTQLREAFAGLPLVYEGVWAEPSVDGRGLAYFEFPDQESPARTADVKQAVIDGLVLFAYHEKTPESAILFLESVGVAGAQVMDGQVVLPVPPAPI